MGFVSDGSNIEKLTQGQPFCAGVVLVRDGKVAVTLNEDGLPHAAPAGMLRIGGVGGGQEPGETLPECALREAKEELGTERVTLKDAGKTFIHDMDTDEIAAIRCSDRIAPFLLQRRTSPNPHRPYKPGLPTGPYIYYGLYLGEAEEIRINREDDVAGILFVPQERWGTLEEEHATLGRLLDEGAELLAKDPIARGTPLWLPPDESMRIAVRLLAARR